MPKYRVELTDWVRHELELEVEANTEEEAREKAVGLADSGEYAWVNTYESQGETTVDFIEEITDAPQ